MKPKYHNKMSGGNVVAQRALDVLEALATARGEALSLSQLVDQLSLPKATVHRLLATLVDRGYVSRSIGHMSGYTLGIRCYELGSLTSRFGNLREAAASEMSNMNLAFGELVVLAIYETGSAVYIDTRRATQPVFCESYVGFRAPATCVSTGRVLLAFQPKAEVMRVLAQPIQRYSEKTIVDIDQLTKLLESSRRTGVAKNYSSYRDGVGGISAAIRDSTGNAIASIGFCLPEYRMYNDRLQQLEKRVISASKEISRRLGCANIPYNVLSEQGPSNPVDRIDAFSS